MAFYGIIIVLTTILSILYTHTKKSQQKYIFFVLVLFPSIFAGLRGVGTDYHFYLNNYVEIVNGKLDLMDYDSLFVIVTRLLGKMGISFQVMVFITALLTIFLAFKIFEDYKQHINFSFTVFSYLTMFYQMSFNLYRQILAAEFFLLATKALFADKNKKRYLVYYVLAAWIHSSLIPFIVVFFLAKFITEKKYLQRRIVLYIISIIGIFLIPFYAENIEKLIPFLQHYSWYLTRFQHLGVGFGILRYFVLAIIPVVFIMYKNMYNELNDNGLGYLSFYVTVGVILWMMSYVSTSTIYRLGYNLLIALPLLHGFIFKKYNKKSRIWLFALVVIIMLLFCYYDGVYINTGATIPFKFYWNS